MGGLILTQFRFQYTQIRDTRLEIRADNQNLRDELKNDNEKLRDEFKSDIEVLSQRLGGVEKELQELSVKVAHHGGTLETLLKVVTERQAA